MAHETAQDTEDPLACAGCRHSCCSLGVQRQKRASLGSPSRRAKGKSSRHLMASK